jgi:hypothetical protein
MVKSLMSLPVVNNFARHNDNTIVPGIALPFSKRLPIFSYRNGLKKYFDGHFFLIALATILKDNAVFPSVNARLYTMVA